MSNFHPLEVVDRSQLQVGENVNEITKRGKGEAYVRMTGSENSPCDSTSMLNSSNTTAATLNSYVLSAIRPSMVMLGALISDLSSTASPRLWETSRMYVTKSGSGPNGSHSRETASPSTEVMLSPVGGKGSVGQEKSIFKLFVLCAFVYVYLYLYKLIYSSHDTLTQCWFTVELLSATLA